MNELYVNFLRNNIDKISWSRLSQNPEAIEFLTENQDKIWWNHLSTNPAALELLMANPEKIDWDDFALNRFQTKKKDDPILTLNNRLMELELKNNLLQLRLDNAELKTKQLRIEFLMLMMCMAVIIIKFLF